MANLPQSLSMNGAFGGGPSASNPATAAAAAAAAAAGAGANKDQKMRSAEQLVLDLCNADARENALLELSKVMLSSSGLRIPYFLPSISLDSKSKLRFLNFFSFSL